jgi:hypothetical protein
LRPLTATGSAPHTRCTLRSDHGCSAEANDAVAAYTNALLFALGGDTAHARAAARIMNAYAGVEKYNNSNAPLQAAWSASKWTRAAELVLHAPGGGSAVWPAADAAAFLAFLVNVELPLIVNETNASERPRLRASKQVKVCAPDLICAPARAPHHLA